MSMFGFLNIQKPVGPTSHDIVARVRGLFPRKTKVGHAGTLDPFASGVLVVCVGPATRLASYIQRQPKRYTAQITLGATSSTDDVTGEVRSAEFAVRSEEEDVRNVLARFVGEIQQVPPAHSAVHVNGRRAYQLVREGQTVKLAPRRVRIHDIQLLRYDWPVVEIDVQCGSGTYIRSLARDVGEALGVGGYCSALARTTVGPFTLETSVTPEDVDLSRDLLPPTTGLDLPTVQLDEEQVTRIRHGKAVILPPSSFFNNAERQAEIGIGLPFGVVGTIHSNPQTADDVALLDSSGNLLGIAKPQDQHLQPVKVFV
jgi:tRNA pseudouridine55 synthase